MNQGGWCKSSPPTNERPRSDPGSETFVLRALHSSHTRSLRAELMRHARIDHARRGPPPLSPDQKKGLPTCVDPPSSPQHREICLTLRVCPALDDVRPRRRPVPPLLRDGPRRALATAGLVDNFPRRPTTNDLRQR